MENEVLTYREVHDALECLAAPDKAEGSPALALCLVENYAALTQTRYLALRRVLEEALAVLQEEKAEFAQVLIQRFSEERETYKIAQDKGVGERTVVAMQQKAITRLTRILNEWEARCQQGLPIHCGETGIDLAYRLPLVSSAFGSYFAGLLQEANSYCYLDQQIECAPTADTRSFPALSRIQFLLRKPRGPLILFIAGASGIGKTTLATKIIKCLFEENDVDTILGGSAKTAYVDIVTQDVRSAEADFRDPLSFYRRLYTQLGLPPVREDARPEQLVKRIRGWLGGRRQRTVITLDNLDSLDDMAVRHLTQMLLPILNRDCRAIVTTRHLGVVVPNAFNVILHPLTEHAQVARFLRWHIGHFSAQQPGLGNLELDNRHIDLLIRTTQGLPLLMQLLMSSVVLFDWSYLEREMPFGAALYDFLYREHWAALANAGLVGETAQALVWFIIDRQNRGKLTTRADLDQWSKPERGADVTAAMRLLADRFLVINRNALTGDYATFPSFVEFIQQQRR